MATADTEDGPSVDARLRALEYIVERFVAGQLAASGPGECEAFARSARRHAGPADDVGGAINHLLDRIEERSAQLGAAFRRGPG